MRNILITGSNGFIGKNLYISLLQLERFNIFSFDLMNSMKDLDNFINKADFIFHLAGVNRSENESDFKKGNVELTGYIVDRLLESKKKPAILMSSSIQALLDNPYGNSKRAAEELLLKYERAGGRVLIYRLSNVFGKWCKPNYNSVVATFCYNIARGKKIIISDQDKVLDLVYIDDVIHEFISVLVQGKEGTRINGFYKAGPVYQIKIKDLALKIYEFNDIRESQLVPDLSDTFTKKLYATYISYLPEKYFSYSSKIKKDSRGILFDFLKSKHFGQIFISVTKPGIMRGNHYHHTKNEKFCVISGEAVIKFRNVLNEEIIDYYVSGDNPEIVDIPPGFTHSITNIGNQDVITIFWANEILDPENPDTFFDPVEK